MQEGLIKPPIWKQQYVCRGDQVYINMMEPRFTFYFRYAGFVEEQLITRCDSHDAWYVPNAELRYCTPKEEVNCEMGKLGLHHLDAPPKIVEGVPAGTASNPRPVCALDGEGNIKAHYATGAASNLWTWSKFRWSDQLEIVPCNNHTAEKTWIEVDTVEPCPSGFVSACDAGKVPVEKM